MDVPAYFEAEVEYKPPDQERRPRRFGMIQKIGHGIRQSVMKSSDQLRRRLSSVMVKKHNDISNLTAGTTLESDDGKVNRTFYENKVSKFISAHILRPRFRWWTVTVIIFIFLLLFAPSLRVFFPKQWDTPFDYFFTLTFLILAIDIIFHSLATPKYFLFDFRCSRHKWISIGSTMFWIDVLSTCFLLFEISYINTPNFSVEKIEIDSESAKMKGFSSFEGDHFRIRFMLLKTIIRASRIGRIVRAIVVRNVFQVNLNSVVSSSTKKISYRLMLSSKKTRKARSHAAVSIQRWWRKQRKKSTAENTGAGKLSSLIPELERNDAKQNKGPKQIVPQVSSLESHVGSAMREITSNKIVIGILIACTITVLFTYSASDGTVPLAMLFLHGQTSLTDDFANTVAVNAAIDTSLPNLYSYTFPNGDVQTFDIGLDPKTLRDKEICHVAITTKDTVFQNGELQEIEKKTSGFISKRKQEMTRALNDILATIALIMVWLLGVMAFVGPVMTLVVVPIERMIILLKMLMIDPLGYQDTSMFSKFMKEEHDLAVKNNWSSEVLKGMETSFLMSTILRIGSLMKVGFGSAGVEIIRKHLEKGEKKSINLTTHGGSTVSCIFLFCDIRQFTDATECLQEEVFVFTNKIAAVVHSICNSYGGSANKNIGDAFLLSWLLPEETNSKKFSSGRRKHSVFEKIKRGTQADKALLSVVKINLALHHDNYFLEGMSGKAKMRLLSKLANRAGPVVQLGFGLHAGKAVQGAIGTQRKLDATYLSEAVEFAEQLESSTKRYGVQVLMSESFYKELNRANRRRVRKVDQVKLDKTNEDDEDELMNLYTFDMDIEAKWNTSNDEPLRQRKGKKERRHSENRLSMKFRGSITDVRNNRRSSLANTMQKVMGTIHSDEDTDPEVSVRNSLRLSDLRKSGLQKTGLIKVDEEDDKQTVTIPDLVLPTGTAMYNEAIWVTPTMTKIRHRANDGLFFRNFKTGLTSYYARDWDEAKQSFQSILDRFEDGPSRLFYNEILKHNGEPPPDFKNFNLL